MHICDQVLDFMKKENAENEKKKQKELELKRGEDSRFLIVKIDIFINYKLLSLLQVPCSFIFSWHIAIHMVFLKW